MADNAGFVRIIRPASEMVTRVKTAMRDSGNDRWTDAEIYSAINRSLDTWANRVYIPHVYTITGGLVWNTHDYSIPNYIREPYQLQRKSERFYWQASPVEGEYGWSEVNGSYLTPDGSGGQYLHVEVGSDWTNADEARILWWSEVSHIPDTTPALDSGISASDTTLVLDAPLLHTIGDVGFVKIDDEIIQYNGATEDATTTTLLDLVRGTSGTTAATHSGAASASWCIPFMDASLYGVLHQQVQSYLQHFFMTDSSARETEHHQWMMRWEQQIADDFWSTWLPNRKARVKLNREAIFHRGY